VDKSLEIVIAINSSEPLRHPLFSEVCQDLIDPGEERWALLPAINSLRARRAETDSPPAANPTVSAERMRAAVSSAAGATTLLQQSHPSAKLFPIAEASRHLAVYDPKTRRRVDHF
jgi:hypothetical protein